MDRQQLDEDYFGVKIGQLAEAVKSNTSASVTNPIVDNMVSDVASIYEYLESMEIKPINDKKHAIHLLSEIKRFFQWLVPEGKKHFSKSDGYGMLKELDVMLLHLLRQYNEYVE